MLVLDLLGSILVILAESQEDEEIEIDPLLVRILTGR